MAELRSIADLVAELPFPHVEEDEVWYAGRGEDFLKQRCLAEQEERTETK